MNCNLTCRAISIVLLVLSGLQWQTPGVFAQAPFYQGKTITVLQGREPGGTGDLRARAVTQFLQKYIPVNPTIIHEFMAGGGGLRAANHMYAVAKPDGLTIGSVSSGMLGSAILGGAGVKYQFEKFHYLGASDAGGHYVFYTRKEAGANNLEKLRAATGIRIGAQSVGVNTRALLCQSARVKKMVGDDAEIVFPAVMDKGIKELPRNPEVVELLTKIAGPNPLPAR